MIPDITLTLKQFPLNETPNLMNNNFNNLVFTNTNQFTQTINQTEFCYAYMRDFLIQHQMFLIMITILIFIYFIIILLDMFGYEPINKMKSVWNKKEKE